MNICENCGGFRFALKPHVDIVWVVDTYILFYKEKLTCEECGQIFYNEEIECANDEREHRFSSIFYDDCDFLHPLQIIDAIRGLGITKEEFAERTGIYLSDLDKIYLGEMPSREFSARLKSTIKKQYKLP